MITFNTHYFLTIVTFPLKHYKTARPAAVTVQAIMAILCLVFLIFAVKSFIDARRAKRE